MLGIDQLCLTTPMIDRDIPMTISSVGFLFFPSSTNRFPVPTSAKLQGLTPISPQILILKTFQMERDGDRMGFHGG
jgi:hypothetical protein